jgi:peptide/nickel transport system permease protein
MTFRVGLGILGAVGLLALLAPVVSPSAPSAQHPTHPLAPPMLPRVRLASGEGWRPHVARLTLTDMNTQAYALGPPLPLAWLAEGTLVRSADARHPLLWLGSDWLGRDVWSRLVHGARYSMGLATLAVVGATVLGAGVGLLAGWRGGVVDTVLMRVTDLFIVLPALYVVLLFRASLPLVLEPSTLFLLMAGVLALAGWPSVARGVRAIVASEREREYVLAARAMGATGWRIVTRHLLPSTLPFLGTQAVLLLPAFIVAEATLSFIGLGFAEPTPSWGTLLSDTFDVRVLREAPWLLAPAVAIALVTVAANLVREGKR